MSVGKEAFQKTTLQALTTRSHTDPERVRARERLLRSWNRARSRQRQRTVRLARKQVRAPGGGRQWWPARWRGWTEATRAGSGPLWTVAGQRHRQPHSAVAKSRTMGRLVGESSAEGFRGGPHPQTLKRNQEKGERESPWPTAVGTRTEAPCRGGGCEAGGRCPHRTRPDVAAREGTRSSLAQDWWWLGQQT